jgi:uncharacterized protein YbjT (DUF2867 family)
VFFESEGTDRKLNNPVTILVAGASGYIGKSLIPELLSKFSNVKIIALSRSAQPSSDKRVQWVACDLFSLKSIEESAPAQVDAAFYLVHSMGPTAQLDQGSFADYDLILADNFAKALKNRNLKHLVYLGGLVPETKALSLHLQSRLEVEEIFAQHQLPTTTFRAGLILGEAGSSFQILLKLVKRLPIMICPAWTQTLTTPVDLATVISALAKAALDPTHIGKIYDLAGCQPLTYIHMMRETARRLGLRRYFLTVPFFTPTLSRLWVSLITNSSKDLVYPLIESLEHAMVARGSHQFTSDSTRFSYFDLLDKVNMKTVYGGSLFQFRVRRKTVRSVQRMSLPPGKNAVDVNAEYFNWLKRVTSPLIRVVKIDDKIKLLLLGKIKLLELNLIAERSSDDRHLMRIQGGLLVIDEKPGRFEFRVVLNRRFVLAAIHDYRPTLPWFIYKYTQAVLHLFVMRRFAKHLAAQELVAQSTNSP